MELLQSLANGFSIALTPTNVFFAFVGVLAGQIIGVLPGIGSVVGVSLLLPLTFGMDPTSAIIMLAGIYYGSQYGGTITSVLINMPGKRRPSPPRSTATRWPGRAGPPKRWVSPPSARSSPAPSAWS